MAGVSHRLLPELVGSARTGHSSGVKGALVVSLALLIVGFTAPVIATAQKSSLPLLKANGIGSVYFGAPKAQVVASLQRSLGAANARGVNTGCGPKFTEVTWHDLIAEFRRDRFAGYRFIEGGWPLSTPGSPHDRVVPGRATPHLETERGITLGSTLGALRRAYGPLSRSGAVQWTAADRLTFSVASPSRDPRSPTSRITEIKVGTCGAF
jgi:hypothetical protein